MTMRTLYIILQLVGVVILLGELFYVVAQKPSNLQKDLIIILFSLIVAFIAYIIELDAPNVEVAMLGCQLGYLGKPFAFLTTLYLLLEYSHIKVNTKITKSVIILFVVLDIIVFTNQYHHLYYPEVSFNESKIGSPLVISHGVFWYVYMVSSFLLYIGYVAIVIYEYKYAKTKQVKKMTMWLFFMMFFSIAGLALFIAGLTYNYDSTLFGTLLGSICLMILLVKYHIFDSLTLAKEATIEKSNNAMIILDAKSNISYYSPNARLFVNALDNTNISHKVENEIISFLDEYKEDTPIKINDRVYSLRIKEYKSKNDLIAYGKSYLFSDITDSYNFQETLKKEVKTATSKIIQIQKDILFAFGDLVEARDGCTGKHIRNVSLSAKLIATELAKKDKYKSIITEEYIDSLEECISLHDIGKISIPDAILNKPGKLNDEERKIMQTHTTIGAKIIEDSMANIEKTAKTSMAKEIALYHHEWFNGTGYPQRIKGEEIPLSARIAAISDVYDALRMVRPYKPAFSKTESLRIIHEETGSHFDPEIIEAFLRIVDRLD